MTCHEIQEKILDGEWSSVKLDEAGKILEHMDNCESCRESLADYDRIRNCLRESVPQETQPIGGWDTFERRLSHTPGRRNGWIVSGLMAASILLAFLGGRFWDRPGDSPVKTIANLQDQFSRKDISEQVAVFHQVSEVFDGKASWIVQAKGTTDVGVVSGAMPAPRELLLLRLAMSRSGRTVSKSDLVIVPGQSAKLSVPFENGQNLNYRISTTNSEPTGLRIWAELERPGQSGEVIAALATTLQIKPGEIRSAGQMVTSSGENELTVAFSKAGVSER